MVFRTRYELMTEKVRKLKRQVEEHRTNVIVLGARLEKLTEENEALRVERDELRETLRPMLGRR